MGRMISFSYQWFYAQQNMVNVQQNMVYEDVMFYRLWVSTFSMHHVPILESLVNVHVTISLLTFKDTGTKYSTPLSFVMLNYFRTNQYEEP